MKIRKNVELGFTLVEIMIVVAIIGLLAAIALPNFVRARETTALNSIMNNLRLIQGAKEEWALENKMGVGTPTSASLAPYMRNNEWPQQLAGETYNINPIANLANATGFTLIGKTTAFADGTTN